MAYPWAFVSALLLTGVFAIPFVPIRIDRSSGYDLFRPERVAALLLGVRVVPFLYVSAFNLDAVTGHHLLRRFQHDDIEVGIVRFAIVQAIAFLLLLMATRIGRPALRIGRWRIFRTGLSFKELIVAGVVAAVLGCAAAAYYYTRIGGLTYLLANLHLRTHITAGHAYLSGVYSALLTFSVLILAYAIRSRPSYSWRLAIIAWTVAVAGIMSLTGGRSDAIGLLFLLVLTWHFSIARIDRIGIGLIVVSAVVALYVIVMPVARSPGGWERLLREPQSFVWEVAENAQSIASGNQYVPIQIFIQDHFDTDNLWLGKSFVDLVFAPVPRGLYPQKPPVDEGVYIYTLLSGKEVEPSLPLTELHKTSWPPSTLGIGYANFWVPGALFAMFLLGRIYLFFYTVVRDSKSSLLAVILYGTIMWRFQISNLGIVMTATDALFLGLIWLAVTRVRLSDNRLAQQTSLRTV